MNNNQNSTHQHAAPRLASSTIQVRQRDKVLDLDSGEVVTVIDSYLVPNSTLDSSLVCCIIAERQNGNRFVTTSNHFAALPSETYVKRYLSDF